MFWLSLVPLGILLIGLVVEENVRSKRGRSAYHACPRCGYHVVLGILDCQRCGLDFRTSGSQQ